MTELTKKETLADIAALRADARTLEEEAYNEYAADITSAEDAQNAVGLAAIQCRLLLQLLRTLRKVEGMGRPSVTWSTRR